MMSSTKGYPHSEKSETLFRGPDRPDGHETGGFPARSRVKESVLLWYIFYFGVWEPAITAFVRRSLSSGDRFVDVGANIGYYTCLASQLVGPSGRVYAIEASPTIYETLLENLDLNEVANAHTLNYAVFDRETTLSVFQQGEGNIGQTSVFQSEDNKLIAKRVKALPLHKLIDRQELYSARLVRIDGNGFLVI